VKFKGFDQVFKHVKDWKSVFSMLSGTTGVGYIKKIKLSQRAPRGLKTLQWGRLYLPNHFRRKPSRMHEWLGERLDHMHEQRGSRINVIGPRGGAKSTIGSMCYVLRAALEGWEPYIWIISDTSSQAETHLKNVKAEIEANELLARDYPQACGIGPVWKTDSIQLKNGVWIECFGTGQHVRGRRKGQHRPSLIVCDDIENDSHIESARQRELSRLWFQTALMNAGNKDTNVISLATALHRDALAMQLCRTPGWESRIFRSILRWPDNMELWQEWERIYSNRENKRAARDAWNFHRRHRAEMEVGAELLWPDEEDLYTLMKIRAEGGHTAFEREKQNSPIDPTRCEWPEEYFGDWLWFDEWPADLAFKVIALDPSKGRDSRFGDYSALVVLGVDRRGLLYVEADLQRRATPVMVADAVTLCRRHQPKLFGVEANQFQELLVDDVVQAFAVAGVQAAVSGVHNYANKLLRIRRLGPHLSQRRLLFLRGSPGTQLLVDQLRDFPLGSHDDGPDALEMAVRLAEQVASGNQDDGLGERLVAGDEW
jgi:predicted phage terminase large subunit-like protein